MISVEMLRRYPYFAGVGGPSLLGVAEVSEEQRVGADQRLFREGETARHLFIVVQGEVDIVFESPNGGQRVVDTVVAGELMCWSAVVDPHRCTATGVTRVETSVIAIDGPRFRGLCEADPFLGYRVMTQVARVLSNRLQGARAARGDDSA